MDITRLCHRRSLLFSPRFQAGPGIEPGPAFRLATEGKETCSVPDDDADGTAVVKDERCPQFRTGSGAANTELALPLPGSAGRFGDP